MKYPYVPKGDKRIRKWNYKKEADEMLKYVKDGDVIYDIGANIGDHSIYFALNKKIKCFSFEPVPEYFQMAKKNISFFGAEGISIFNVGISNKLGIMEMAKDNEGSTFLTDIKSTNKFEIKVETIDHLVTNGMGMPDLIKIDVEGWAEFALLGARNTIQKSKPIIILEPHPGFLNLSQLESKFKVLEDIGYKIKGSIFNNNREFILQFGEGDTFEDYRDIFENQIINERIWRLREKYDKSTSKKEIIKINGKYEKLISRGKVRFLNRLIWSKLYRLFTGKWLKTK